jgi:hypothetical protein
LAPESGSSAAECAFQLAPQEDAVAISRGD